MGERVPPVGVARAAAQTVRRVRNARHGAARNILETEVHGLVRHIPAERRGERAVGIQTQRRAGGFLDARGDEIARVRHLAVAVKLVAEEICHDHRARLQRGGDGGKIALVALDNGKRLLRLAEKICVFNELCGNAAREICAGAVGEIRRPGLVEHMAEHAGGRRFAVCAGDDHRFHAAAQLAHQPRIYAQRCLSGQRCAAAAKKPQRETSKAARGARKKYAQFFHRRIYSSRPAPTDTQPMRQPTAFSR